MNSSNSNWIDITYGFPQESILGPLFLIYTFVISKWKTGYVDDNILNGFIQKFNGSEECLFPRFANNYMKVNTDSVISHYFLCRRDSCASKV